MVSIIFGCAMVACSKMDGTYKDFLKGGEIRYSAKPDSIQVFPGHNRIKLSWLLVSAPNVVSCRVYWNDMTDSVEVPVNKVEGNDTSMVSVIIDDLDEGLYTFNVYTYDDKGNPSIKSDTSGRVYGETYVGSLINRPIESAVLVNGNPRIQWDEEPDKHALGVELRYKNKEAKVVTVSVPVNETITRIDDEPLGDSIQYRTLFLPDSNVIDTFYSSFQTLYLEDAEPVELNSGLFKELKLPTDAPDYTGYSVSNLWDGDLEGKSWYRTQDGSGSPHWYTIDLGSKVKLANYTVWQRGVVSEHRLLYANANPRVWEIWGSSDPAPDGSWNGWIKLLECTSEKPSGLPLGQRSDLDVAHALKGETFIFSKSSPAVRYIRIKVLATWDPADADHSFLQELSFYGIPY